MQTLPKPPWWSRAAPPPDTREREAWFQDLPEDLKQEIREERMEQSLAGRKNSFSSVDEVVTEALLCALLFLLVDAFFSGMELSRLFGSLVAGAVVGVVNCWIRAGQLLAPMIAMPAFFLYATLHGQGAGGTSMGAIAGPLFVGSVAAYLGMRRTARSYDL